MEHTVMVLRRISEPPSSASMSSDLYLLLSLGLLIFFPLSGGLPWGALKLFLLLDEGCGWLWLDCRLPELLLGSLSVVVWVCWHVELAEGGRTEGTFCPSGHVKSVCTWSERVVACVGPLFEATTAAVVRPPWAGLPSLSALTILRASINDMPLSAFTCCTFFQTAIWGSFCRRQEWLLLQFRHFGSLMQWSLMCPTWPHLAQVSLPLQALFPWPNFWQLKQRSGFGMYVDTKVFWNGWCLESNYESVGVSSAARVIFDCDVAGSRNHKRRCKGL